MTLTMKKKYLLLAINLFSTFGFVSSGYSETSTSEVNIQNVDLKPSNLIVVQDKIQAAAKAKIIAIENLTGQIATAKETCIVRCSKKSVSDIARGIRNVSATAGALLASYHIWQLYLNSNTEIATISKLENYANHYFQLTNPLRPVTLLLGVAAIAQLTKSVSENFFDSESTVTRADLESLESQLLVMNKELKDLHEQSEVIVSYLKILKENDDELKKAH